MRVAIMQPYFFPYLGYFRLFQEADVFVIFDDVQFPRRGWVHRNRGRLDNNWVWVTMPLKKAERSACISELEFRDGALDSWVDEQKTRLAHATPNPVLAGQVLPWPGSGESPRDYLDRSLRWTVSGLGLQCDIVRSSDIEYGRDGLSGEQKILALCEHLGATDYINLPGGVGLYSDSTFDRAGITLHILPDLVDSYESVLFRVVREGFDGLRKALDQLAE